MRLQQKHAISLAANTNFVRFTAKGDGREPVLKHTERENERKREKERRDKTELI